MNKEKIIQFLKSKSPYLLIVLLLVALASVLTWRYYHPVIDEHAGHNMEEMYPTSFFVRSMDFAQVNSTADAYVIIMSFSQPVDPEKLKDYFEISPVVNGKFERYGDQETDVIYSAERPFESGVSYNIVFRAGLASKIGGVFQQDFTKVLAMDFSPDDFKVMKNGRFSLVQSVQVGNIGSLKAHVGNQISDPKLKIYKAKTGEEVLKDVLSHMDLNNYVYDIKGVSTDVSKLQVVTEQTNIKYGSDVNVPNEPGLYLVQAFSGTDLISQVWVTVNTMGVHLRQDDQKIVFAAQNLSTNEPVNNVEVKLYDVSEDNKTTKLLQTKTISGLSEVPFVFPNEFDIAIARSGNEYAFVPVRMNGSLAEIGVYTNLSENWQGFLYTERPIYKPNDVIKFRGLLRKDNDAQYTLPPAGTKMGMSMQSYTGSTVPQQEYVVETNDYGIFFGEIKLDGKLAPGQYYLNANLADGTNGGYIIPQAWFEILEYKKPPFELKAQTDKDEYIEGETMKVTIGGNRFDGGAFSEEDITYKVYAMDFYETEKAVYNQSFLLNGWGGMCGGGGFSPYETYYGEPVGEAQEITTGTNGLVQLSFDTKKLTRNVSQQLTFVAEKTDQNGNVISQTKSAIVHNGEINIFVRPFKNQTVVSPEPTAIFSAETLTGEKQINKTFDYTIEQTRWDTIDGNYQQVSKPFASGKVTTNAEGVGEFKLKDISKREAGYDSINVNVSTTDKRGNKIVGTQSLYVYSNSEYDAPTLLEMSSTDTNLIPGKNGKLKINAPDNLKVLLAYERGRVYDSRWVDLKKGENIFEFSVEDQYMPSITMTFSAFYKNRYFVEGLTFNVPAMKKLVNVSITTDKPEYSPGQVAKVTIKTTNQEGQPLKTNLSLGVIDKAIFALRKNTTLPLHSTFYYFRGRRTNNSSSMTGINFGEGAERGGGGDNSNAFAGKDVDVLYWNPSLETNDNGEAEVFINVVGTTIWKGLVYVSSNNTELGQGEFEFSSK